VADLLAIIIEHMKNDRQIEGVVPHLVDGGLYLLQYADDMILFMEHDTEKCKKSNIVVISFREAFRIQNQLP
jgi:hypothetical protein